MAHFIGLQEELGVSEVERGFPGVFHWRIAFPSDMKLSVGSGAPVGDDGFHGVFFFSVDDGRRGG